jgi:hypothetical protein
MTDSNFDKPGGFRAEDPSQVGEQRGAAYGGRSRMTDQARSMIRGSVSERASKSALGVSDLARTLRQTSRQLEGNTAGSFVDRAADQLDRVSELLETKDPEELVHNVERFAREQPLLFLGGAFALGIAGARFLKSSGARAQPPEPAFGTLGEPIGEIGGIEEGFRP